MNAPSSYKHMPIRRKLQLCETYLIGARDELNRAHQVLEDLGVRNTSTLGRRLSVPDLLKLYVEEKQNGKP